MHINESFTLKYNLIKDSKQSFMGCYADAFIRDLPYQVPTSSLPYTSVEICATMCAKSGFIYAGLQNR